MLALPRELPQLMPTNDLAHVGQWKLTLISKVFRLKFPNQAKPEASHRGAPLGHSPVSHQRAHQPTSQHLHSDPGPFCVLSEWIDPAQGMSRVDRAGEGAHLFAPARVSRSTRKHLGRVVLG